jgi:hypothetical protein
MAALGGLAASCWAMKMLPMPMPVSTRHFVAAALSRPGLARQHAGDRQQQQDDVHHGWVKRMCFTRSRFARP